MTTEMGRSLAWQAHSVINLSRRGTRNMQKKSLRLASGGASLLAGEIVRSEDDCKSVGLERWHVTMLQRRHAEQATVQQACRTSDIVPGSQMGQQGRHSG